MGKRCSSVQEREVKVEKCEQRENGVAYHRKSKRVVRAVSVCREEAVAQFQSEVVHESSENSLKYMYRNALADRVRITDTRRASNKEHTRD